VRERLILERPHLGLPRAVSPGERSIDVADKSRRAIGPPRAAPEHSRAHPECDLEQLRPHLQLAETLGLAAQPDGWRIATGVGGGGRKGAFANHPLQPLVVGALKGLLSSALGDRITHRECLPWRRRAGHPRGWRSRTNTAVMSPVDRCRLTSRGVPGQPQRDLERCSPEGDPAHHQDR